MDHRSSINKLGRNHAHRKALLRSQAKALFRYERIRTTVSKAKEARRLAEAAREAKVATQMGNQGQASEDHVLHCFKLRCARPARRRPS